MIPTSAGAASPVFLVASGCAGAGAGAGAGASADASVGDGVDVDVTGSGIANILTGG